MEIGARIIVKGLVQGVGFRYFVLRKALPLGIKGFVQNRFTGEVEIEAEGERSLIEELIKEVRIGPRSAHVKDVTIEWQTFQNKFDEFTIG
ncbi:MAG: acylphosphatase [Ignavibacteria bacterium GWA2_55_25]|nr:acylphosphatase [Ignavibacteriales bacterium]OGU18655.1 MAG: acylphosphatase [Ignavibacteria bacterium GWA2_55_25]